MRITVVGAGIVGLASALRLREAGHQVHIVAERTGAQTTSAVAAALWFPYLAAPQDAVARWAAGGLRALTGLATTAPPAGVDLRTGRQLFRTPTPDPWWTPAAPPLRRLSGDELPAGFGDGIEITVPVVDTPLHLSWLTERLRAMGTPVTRRKVSSLDDAAGASGGADVVVNCAGLGARELAADPALEPVRGQVVVLEQTGLREWILDDTDPVDLTYVVPRRTTIVVGGTAQRGDGDVRLRDTDAHAMLRRAIALLPELAHAAIVDQRVGLRPARSAVRLERTDERGVDAVHCYGHGGAGVTLAYGCADEVVQLIATGQVPP
ncbi:MAG TPA: FAD-dependent oxidoreductase [Jatrophihabitantaceae bacterium]|jgi:D-amino-acid oxidase